MQNSTNDNEKTVDSLSDDAVEITDEPVADSDIDIDTDMDIDMNRDVDVDEPKHIEKKPASDSTNILKIASVLAIISLVTAFMLAALNSVTASAIQARKDEEKAQAVAALFGDNIEIEELPENLAGNLLPPVTEILYIWDKNDTTSLIGYCVTTQPKGFGGKITILVALSPDEKITGINILEMSETAGIGTQVREDSFLEQFKGIGGDISAGSVDTISGATISSKAVLNGIDEALKQIKTAIR